MPLKQLQAASGRLVPRACLDSAVLTLRARRAISIAARACREPNTGLFEGGLEISGEASGAGPSEKYANFLPISETSKLLRAESERQDPWNEYP